MAKSPLERQLEAQMKQEKQLANKQKLILSISVDR